MRSHLREHYPQESALLDDEKLAEWVHEGLSRAAGAGLESRYDLRRFLELSIKHRGFPGDTPALEWAHRILQQAELSATERMDRIDAAEAFAPV